MIACLLSILTAAECLFKYKLSMRNILFVELSDNQDQHQLIAQTKPFISWLCKQSPWSADHVKISADSLEFWVLKLIDNLLVVAEAAARSVHLHNKYSSNRDKKKMTFFSHAQLLHIHSLSVRRYVHNVCMSDIITDCLMLQGEIEWQLE